MAETKQDETQPPEDKTTAEVVEESKTEVKEITSDENLAEATKRLDLLQRNRSPATQQELNDLSEAVRAYKNKESYPTAGKPASSDKKTEKPKEPDKDKNKDKDKPKK